MAAPRVPAFSLDWLLRAAAGVAAGASPRRHEARVRGWADGTEQTGAYVRAALALLDAAGDADPAQTLRARRQHGHLGDAEYRLAAALADVLPMHRHFASRAGRPGPRPGSCRIPRQRLVADVDRAIRELKQDGARVTAERVAQKLGMHRATLHEHLRQHRLAWLELKQPWRRLLREYRTGPGRTARQTATGAD
jgi:hypothetical protein